MKRYRIVLWLLAVVLAALCGYLIGRHTGRRAPCISSSSVERDRGDSSGLCMLLLYMEFHPCDRVEVVANGESLGIFHEPKTGSDPRVRRIVFTGGGGTHFIFKLFREDALAYKPEFDVALKAGTMLDVMFLPAEKRGVSSDGPEPRCHSPGLIDGVPSKLWCWFGPANARTDIFSVTLPGPAGLPAFRAKLTAHGYTIRREGSFSGGSTPWLQLEPVKGKTVVDGLQEIEKWRDVKAVHTVPESVY